MNTQISRVSFRDFCKSEGVTSICKTVRVNQNGYPYATILRGAVAENIYFSKKAAAEVSEGLEMKSIANLLYINTAVNSDGESRTKLSFAGNSNYEDVDSMFE